jgi:hypothetical protein
MMSLNLQLNNLVNPTLNLLDFGKKFKYKLQSLILNLLLTKADFSLGRAIFILELILFRLTQIGVFYRGKNLIEDA